MIACNRDVIAKNINTWKGANPRDSTRPCSLSLFPQGAATATPLKKGFQGKGANYVFLN